VKEQFKPQILELFNPVAQESNQASPTMIYTRRKTIHSINTVAVAQAGTGGDEEQSRKTSGKVTTPKQQHHNRRWKLIETGEQQGNRNLEQPRNGLQARHLGSHGSQRQRACRNMLQN
jgi:hypothetical protein